MTNKKWFAPILPYLAVWAGLFLFHSAWLALLGLHVGMLLALIVIRPNILFSILFQSKNIKWIFVSIAFCSTSGIGLYFLWDYFGIANNLSAQLLALGLNSSSWFVFIAYFSLVNPFIEEYFWRAVLGSFTKKLYLSDLIYASYHSIVLWGRVNLITNLLAVGILISAGWIWRQIAREDEGLLAPVLGHVAADFSILMAIYWMCT